MNNNEVSNINKFIYKYWNHTKLGQAMIQSNNVSDSDLLFLIPNNTKKKLGLPLTRISGNKKRKQKDQRKRFITSFKLFDLIEEVIEKTIGSKLTQDEWLGQFVEVNYIAKEGNDKMCGEYG